MKKTKRLEELSDEELRLRYKVAIGDLLAKEKYTEILVNYFALIDQAPRESILKALLE